MKRVIKKDSGKQRMSEEGDINVNFFLVYPFITY